MTHRIDLLARLSRLRDEEAGKLVSESRQILDASRKQAQLLREYRRSLSAAGFAGLHIDGAQLRASAAFAQVAEQAQAQAMKAVEQSKKSYDQALQEWFALRHKRQIMERKADKSHKDQQRSDQDRSDEASRETQAANRR